jgi:toxin secretion/phage lysis holin
MKYAISTAIGVTGSFIASLFGGWTAAMTTLVIFMAIDYFSGIIVASVFHQSPKTETGTLESRAGFKGLCRKGMILLFVLIGYRLDLALDVNYIKDAVCIAFMVNELISIVENAGLMGLPIPSVITKAIDVLNDKKGGDE